MSALGVGGLFCIGWAVTHSKLEAPEPTAYLTDRQGRFLGEVGAAPGGEYGYWRLKEDALPDRVAAATIAIEDRRFWSHPGVDPLAIGRAVWQNFTHGKRISGASTLAMQVVRMQAPAGRNFLRKGLEALAAAMMTARYGREAVLAHYLRIVPYGNRIHGIAYAARRYLDKPVEDLSWAEIAFLSALPQAPTRMNPFDPEGRYQAQVRGGRILELLSNQGVMPAEEYALARSELSGLQIQSIGRRPEAALHAILRLEKEVESSAIVHRGGGDPVVPTTLDLDIQAEAVSILGEAVQRLRGRGANNGAMIVVDHNTNEIIAWVGSSDYFDQEHAGAIDYATVPRSPGSTLKPFLYAQALDRRTITPSTILDDLTRTPDGIGNSDDGFLGPLLPRVALANSRNVPAIELLRRIGLYPFYDFLRQLELHDDSVPVTHYGMGLAIGGLPISLEQLVQAYSVFTAGGTLQHPQWFMQSANAEPGGEPRRIMAEETARQIVLYLSDPLARLPSFPRMGATEFRFPVAVKTGTSAGFRDVWTVGFSSRYLVGVWMGDPDHRPMSALTGYEGAAGVVRTMLSALHPDRLDGLTDTGFPPPRGYESRRICRLTGALATQACDQVQLEWYRPGEEPANNCSAHIRLAVDKRNGRPAAAATPREFVEVRGFVDLPARYEQWMRTSRIAGIPGRERGTYLFNPGGLAADSLSLAPGRSSLRQPEEYKISVTAPNDGTQVYRDPETPPGQSTLALRAMVDPLVPQLVWYVDGLPVAVADYPYTLRWPLAPGEHSIHVAVPFAPFASSRVKVTVR